MTRQPCAQLSAPLCYARQNLLGTAPPRIGQGKPFIRWQIRTPTSLEESRIHQICAADHMPLTGPGSTVSRSSLSWPCICDPGVGLPAPRGSELSSSDPLATDRRRHYSNARLVHGRTPPGRQKFCGYARVGAGDATVWPAPFNCPPDANWH